MKLVVVVNIRKPKMLPALEELMPWVQARSDVVAIDRDASLDLSQGDADGILVLGGDGTLLSVARRLSGRQIPLMGVNFGRLGFLASFTPAQLKDHFEYFVAGKLPVSSRLMIETSVLPVGCDCKPHDCEAVKTQRRFASSALNDATDGPAGWQVQGPAEMATPRRTWWLAMLAGTAGRWQTWPQALPPSVDAAPAWRVHGPDGAGFTLTLAEGHAWLQAGGQVWRAPWTVAPPR